MASPSVHYRICSRRLLVMISVVLGGCGLHRLPPEVDRSQDARIRTQVESRLASEPSLDAGAFRVMVEGATVALYGTVRGMGAWQCALTNAGLVSGVRTVVDFLVIERGERDVHCLAPRPDSSVIIGGET